MFAKSLFLGIVTGSVAVVAACGGRIDGTSSSLSASSPSASSASTTAPAGELPAQPATERDAGPTVGYDGPAPLDGSLYVDNEACPVNRTTITPRASGGSMWTAVVDAQCPSLGVVSVFVMGQDDVDYPQTQSTADVNLAICGKTDATTCGDYFYGATPMYGAADASCRLDHGPTTSNERAEILFAATVGNATATHVVSGTAYWL